jgi:hypothetical protein
MQMNHPSNHLQPFPQGPNTHHLIDEPIKEEVTIEDEVHQLSRREKELQDEYEQLLLQEEEEESVRNTNQEVAV